MKKKIIYFILGSIILYSCDNNNDVFKESANSKKENLINQAKFDYFTKFKHLNHFKDYLSTPLWNESEIISNDSMFTISVPYKKQEEYSNIDPRLIIFVTEEKTKYFIEIKNEISNDDQSIYQRSLKEIGIYNNKQGQSFIQKGYFDGGSFIISEEIALLNCNEVVSRAGQTFSCNSTQCHSAIPLPEVVVVPDQPFNNWSDWDIWYEHWYNSLLWQGGGSLPNVQPSLQIKSITKGSVKLDRQGIVNLNARLLELLVECGYRSMYDYLKNRGKGFQNVEYRPTLNGLAGYNIDTKDLLFLNNNTINNGLGEEFIHMFQDNYYSGGLHQYDVLGRINIEFEAKVLQDVMCLIKGDGCPMYGAGKNYSRQYTQWLFTITNNATKIPSYMGLLTKYQNLNYWDFIQDYRNLNNAYSGYPIHNTLIPAVFNFLNQSNCNK